MFDEYFDAAIYKAIAENHIRVMAAVYRAMDTKSDLPEIGACPEGCRPEVRGK